ncbi:hypothetical protein G6F56_004637 [Rhizopus delemar]|nr:hypothetical protein G6F56_004637 [Rhizopus delemar]
MSSEEYEVEKIVDHKIFGKKYLIKWLNYDNDENTWERSDNLNCVDMVEKYWDTVSDCHPDKIAFKKAFQKPNKPVVVENIEDSATEDNEETSFSSIVEKVPEKRALDDDELQTETKRTRTEPLSLEDKEKEEETKKTMTKIKLVVNENDSPYTVENSSEEDKSEEEREEEEIVFDDTFGLDKEDWPTLTDKVEYIGREVEGSPLFCLVRWNDGSRSFHPLSLVREKCPQLVIDAFVNIVNENK